MRFLGRFIRKIISLILIIVFIIAAVLTAGGWLKYKKATEDFPISEAAEKITSNESFTPVDNISLTFVNAMVAVEDRRFHKHNGVDIPGVIRALVTNIKEKSLIEGVSCITQQLAKNMYFINDNTLTRKIAEIFVAVELEKIYSKKEILELYFNSIYYGSGYYNIADATYGYFGKSPYDISDYEATLLAGIPNAPSVYSLDNNPHLAKQRQKRVVEAMLSVNYLTQEEADAILMQQ